MYLNILVKKLIIYTDGGSRGNPGPSGIGVVIKDSQGNILKRISKFLGRRTNNYDEYEAVVEALGGAKTLLDKGGEIEVRMDSELVQRQLSGKYQIKEESLFPSFIKIHNLEVKYFPKIKYVHVRREDNKEADFLANQAMDRG